MNYFKNFADNVNKIIAYCSVENIMDWTSCTYCNVRGYVQPYVSTAFNANKIVDNLYIGDLASACNLDELKKLGITHIVTVINGINPIHPEHFTYKIIAVRDQPSIDLSQHFDETADFIDDAIRQGGKVFVHCMCGISRSATIVAAYLIAKHQLTNQQALELIKKCRDCIDPNSGFREQLKSYADKKRTILSLQI